MPIIVMVIIAFLVLGIILAPLSVDRPREPITAGQAVFTVSMNLLLVGFLIAAHI